MFCLNDKSLFINARAPDGRAPGAHRLDSDPHVVAVHVAQVPGANGSKYHTPPPHPQLRFGGGSIGDPL